VKVGAVVLALALLYMFWPRYELQAQALDSEDWATKASAIWSYQECRRQGHALHGVQWRCRQNDPWHLLFQTGTRYDPRIRGSQDALSGDGGD